MCTKLNKLQSSKVSTYCVLSTMQQVVPDNMWLVHKLLVKLLPNITLSSSYTTYKMGSEGLSMKVRHHLQKHN